MPVSASEGAVSAQKGMPITNLMRLLGHTDLKATMRYQSVQNTDSVQAQIEQYDSP
jgi:hypothetical protein